jgi:hypothetical protein
LFLSFFVSHTQRRLIHDYCFSLTVKWTVLKPSTLHLSVNIAMALVDRPLGVTMQRSGLFNRHSSLSVHR